MQLALVISNQPLHRDGLRLIVQQATSMTVTTAPNTSSGVRLATKFKPAIIVIDAKQIDAAVPLPFLERADGDVTVVTIDWKADSMVIYSRTAGLPATLNNLFKVLKKRLRNME